MIPSSTCQVAPSSSLVFWTACWWAAQIDQEPEAVILQAICSACSSCFGWHALAAAAGCPGTTCQQPRAANTAVPIMAACIILYAHLPGLLAAHQVPPLMTVLSNARFLCVTKSATIVSMQLCGRDLATSSMPQTLQYAASSASAAVALLCAQPISSATVP